jgi:hypothetical protein
MRIESLQEFVASYKPSGVVAEGKLDDDRSGVLEFFLSRFGGLSFNDGIYRMHTRESSERWSQIAASVFSELKLDIGCFGYDWLGRQFALDTTRKSAKEGMVLMLDVELGQVYSTNRNFIDFHNIELVKKASEFLGESEFREWLNFEKGKPLAWSECVGFQIPLVLGGKDELDNPERCNMEVYWSICAQILDQTEPLPEGTRIERLSAEVRG